LSAIRMPAKYYPTLTSVQWYNGQGPCGTPVRKALFAGAILHGVGIDYIYEGGRKIVFLPFKIPFTL